MKKSIIVLIVGLVLPLCLIASSRHITTKCERVNYSKVNICFYPDYGQVSYTANNYGLLNMPQDASLDGKYFKISGQPVSYNYCEMIIVEKLIPCKPKNK